MLKQIRPRLSDSPPKTGRKELVRAVEDIGAERVALAFKWAHESDHPRAKFLREHGGGQPSWVTVCRHAGEYIEFAELWKAGTPTQDKEAWLKDWRETLDTFDSACRLNGFTASREGFLAFLGAHRRAALPVPESVLDLVDRRIARSA